MRAGTIEETKVRTRTQVLEAHAAFAHTASCATPCWREGPGPPQSGVTICLSLSNSVRWSLKGTDGGRIYQL